MRLTLGKAKEYLAKFAPADVIEYRLNRVCERLLLDGKFSGSLVRLALVAKYGQITLPRRYRTVEGIKVGGRVHEIANHWYEFLPGKGDLCGFSLNTVRDLGDGWAIMYDLPIDGTLTTAYAGGGTHVITVEGEDEDGMPIELVFNGQETKANPFTKINRVHKEQIAVPVTLYHTAADTTVTNMALIEPSEEETFYRRYIDDSITATAETAVTALCKIRHIEFSNDSDVLPFSNLSALENGLNGLQYEAENDKGLAKDYFDTAVSILNAELADTNADNSLPAIRFVYPAGTTPQFTSFY